MASDVQTADEGGAPDAGGNDGGDDGSTTRRSRFTMPSAYTILFALIVVMAVATWIIPAGTYKLDDQGAPVPGTYSEVESNPPGGHPSVFAHVGHALPGHGSLRMS